MSQIKIRRGSRPKTWGELQSWLRRAKSENGDEFVAKAMERVTAEYKRLCRDSVPEDKARARSLSVLPGFVK